MNGFTNNILSFLLSWLRALISNIWAMFSSEDGGNLYRFLADNWQTLLLLLLVGGFVTDRIIYFFRWRPDYVWASRRQRRKERRLAARQKAHPVPFSSAPEPFPEFPEPVSAIAHEPIFPQPYFPEDPGVQEANFQWDEDVPLDDWNDMPVPQPAVSRPDPLAYMRDVQSGFAPAAPPEQLYAPVPAQEPVHPGLNEEAFRQSFGLEEYEAPKNVMHAPAFRPFTAVQEEAPQKVSSFSRFVRKARDFVGMDEDHVPTIRDLQNNVDVSQAFHEPVYPQPLDHRDQGR